MFMYALKTATENKTTSVTTHFQSASPAATFDVKKL